MKQPGFFKIIQGTDEPQEKENSQKFHQSDKTHSTICAIKASEEISCGKYPDCKMIKVKKYSYFFGSVPTYSEEQSTDKGINTTAIFLK